MARSKLERGQTAGKTQPRNDDADARTESSAQAPAAYAASPPGMIESKIDRLCDKELHRAPSSKQDWQKMSLIRCKAVALSDFDDEAVHEVWLAQWFCDALMKAQNTENNVFEGATAHEPARLILGKSSHQKNHKKESIHDCATQCMAVHVADVNKERFVRHVVAKDEKPLSDGELLSDFVLEDLTHDWIFSVVPSDEFFLRLKNRDCMKNCRHV